MKYDLDEASLTALKALLAAWEKAERGVRAPGMRLESFGADSEADFWREENLPETLALRRFLGTIREDALDALVARYWAAKASESEHWRLYLGDARQARKRVAHADYLSEKRGSQSFREAVDAACADA